jgi:hypothetical protein
MHHTVDVRKSPKYLTMDETFAVPLRRILVDWGTVPNTVRYEILLRFDQSWRARIIRCNQVLVWCQWVSKGDVSKRVDKSVLVQDVICAD